MFNKPKALDELLYSPLYQQLLEQTEAKLDELMKKARYLRKFPFQVWKRQLNEQFYSKELLFEISFFGLRSICYNHGSGGYMYSWSLIDDKEDKILHLNYYRDSLNFYLDQPKFKKNNELFKVTSLESILHKLSKLNYYCFFEYDFSLSFPFHWYAEMLERTLTTILLFFQKNIRFFEKKGVLSENQIHILWKVWYEQNILLSQIEKLSKNEQKTWKLLLLDLIKALRSLPLEEISDHNINQMVSQLELFLIPIYQQNENEFQLLIQERMCENEIQQK